ncbi:MAG: phage holin family protein [Synechococcus sp.]
MDRSEPGRSESSSSEPVRPRGVGAAGRVTALAASVMDLHVRIALQEVDRERRRLISGGVFLAFGGILMLLALIAVQVVLVLWLEEAWGLSLVRALLAVAISNVVLAGISLRVGGQLTKGPYLPQTLEGISRTTKAVLGR